ncbi:MAG: hypothetical protein HY577_02090 [Candidatus Nealsonbacteria bacterium]|nr:hypothetical protein [Candidatus Nealsonbacteria bacterium]
MKKLFLLIFLLVVLAGAFLIVKNSQFFLKFLPGGPQGPAGGGIWSGVGVRLSFTDLQTGRVEKILLASENSLPAKVSDLDVKVKDSDYKTYVLLIVGKRDGSKEGEFILHPGESAIFEGIKIEIEEFLNSSCPPGAQC